MSIQLSEMQGTLRVNYNLFCKSMDWFLYKRDLHHERFKTLFIHIQRESVLTCCKAQFVFFAFWLFFYLAFLSRIFTIHRTVGEEGGYLLISFLPLPPSSQTFRYQLSYCCTEFTSGHNWQLESNMEPLVHTLQNSPFLHLHWQLLLENASQENA